MKRIYTVDRAMEVAEGLGISDRELCRRSGLLHPDTEIFVFHRIVIHRFHYNIKK